MILQVERHLFSVDEYEKMIERGIFEEDDRIELIKGEILEMAPIGFEHSLSVARLTRLFIKLVNDQAVVWAQSPIRLINNSQPQPDLALIRPGDDLFPKSLPTPQDVLLLVEVADTSINYDRGVKLKIYAEAGIPEYWIVNLQEAVIEAYSEPENGEYRQVKQAKRGGTLALPGGLQGIVKMDEVLGEGS